MTSHDIATQSRLRQHLSGNPLALEAAQAARALSFAAGCAADVDIVVFEQDRSFVAASSDARAFMAPRPMTSTESALLASSSPRSWTGWPNSGWTVSVPICSAGVTVGAVTATWEREPAAADQSIIDGLCAIARMLEHDLSREVVIDDDEAAFMKSLVHGQRDPVLVLDEDLTVKWISGGIGTLLGLTPSAVVGRSAAEYLHPDDIEKTLNGIARFSQGLEMYRVEVRLANGNGEYVPVEVHGSDLTADPNVRGIVLSLRDAQRDREHGIVLERTERRAHAIISSLQEGVVATDEFGAITTVNDAARQMFGIEPSTAPAQLHVSDFALVTLDGRTLNPMHADDDTTEVCVLPTLGDVRYVTSSRRTVHDDHDTVTGQVVVFLDVTATHRSTQILREQALHDQLTGLANRRQLNRRLDELTRQTWPGGLAACFIDLDNFKSVNDTHGHQTGDLLVGVAAQRLKPLFGEGELLVRQGGDEFVALLVGIPHVEEALRRAEECRTVLAEPYFINGEVFHLTASIGVAMSDSPGSHPDEILQHADLALYAAKDMGRNRVECFDSALAETATTQEKQRRILREALDENRVVMHFQPLVDVTTERAVGYESLARIKDHEGNLMGPGPIIDAITNTPLMWELDKLAFEMSCQAAALLARIDPVDPPYVACNFAPSSISHPNFLQQLEESTAAAGILPKQVSIEVTESAAFDSSLHGGTTLAKLAARGYLLALDDFGTGYSSLSHIRDLPITSIKVDRSFVNRLEHGTSERSITEAVIGLATDLGLTTVAEGVETEEQLQHTRDLGFTTIQGWHYARAMSLTECLNQWARQSAPLEPAG